MAAAGVACLDARDFKRNDLRIEQRYEPAHRTHQALRLAGAPVHVFGPVESKHLLGQLGAQQLRCGTACALDGRAHILAFGRGHFFQIANGNSGLLRKGLCGRRGRALFERDLPRGAGELLFSIGLAGEHALGQHGQAARRGVGGDAGALGQQALAGEQVGDAAAQFGLGAGNHAGGNFFKTEFKQEI